MCSLRSGSPILFVSLAALIPVILQAQVDRTAITGTVTDQQGNRVPECRVRARERATGFERQTVTTSQGSYEVPGLPPGFYSIRFLKDGFSPFSADGVELVVGQTRTLNARLELAHGQQQTTVTEPLV
jgi:Carboxypeptidase regulatory-like domain